MTLTNAQLLETRAALQRAAQQELPGREALRVGRALQSTDQAARPLDNLKRDLLGKVQSEEHEMTQQKADDEWEDVLADTVEVAVERLSDAVLDHLQLPAWAALALDRVIGGDASGK